jgi:YspA, cpYpsA-related SLOG family
VACQSGDPPHGDRAVNSRWPSGEPHQASSPTDRVILEMQMYGHRPHQDEPDPRPLPDETAISAALAGVFEIIAGMLGDTRLEPDLEDLLWSLVNLFHRAGDRIVRDLDRNEDAQRSSQREQDGTEVRSVELERLTQEGLSLVDRRNAFEFMRDDAADLFEAHTGSIWRPRTGSKVNHANMTASVIDSRDFLAARRRAETEVLLPTGTKIAVSGGLDFNDHQRIWDALDKAHERHPDMVMLHGGSPRGAERIAACWANSRKVTQIPFKPDWNRHAKAAPFRRNDQLLSVMPAGVIVFPGSGITENLADKARRLGIPVWRFTDGGA